MEIREKVGTIREPLMHLIPQIWAAISNKEQATDADMVDMTSTYLPFRAYKKFRDHYTNEERPYFLVLGHKSPERRLSMREEISEQKIEAEARTEETIRTISGLLDHNRTGDTMENEIIAMTEEGM